MLSIFFKLMLQNEIFRYFITALISAFIAYKFFMIKNEIQNKSRFFQQRKDFYIKIKDYIWKIIEMRCPEKKPLDVFDPIIDELWLFKKDIKKYIFELYRKSDELYSSYHDRPHLKGKEYEDNIENHKILLYWFNRESRDIESRFKKYLQL